MRSNLFKVFRVATVASGIAVIAFTGCSSTGSYKMPGADLFSWGKKKPADTSVATTSRNNLPAPPSSTATPQNAPNYAAPPAANYQQERLATNPMAPSGSFGPTAGNPYPNTGHPAPTSTSQGFYSHDYAPASGGHSPHGPGAMAPNPYSQAGTASGGSTWSNSPAPQYAPPSGGYGGASPQSPYSGSGGYSQTAAAPSNPYAVPPSTALPSQGYEYPHGGQEYSGQSGSVYADPHAGPAYSAPQAEMQAWQTQAAGEPYRPGSTGRSTPSSDALRVAEGQGPGIQPASFSGADDQHSPAQPGGSAAQTATPVGQDYTYPSIYR